MPDRTFDTGQDGNPPLGRAKPSRARSASPRLGYWRGGHGSFHRKGRAEEVEYTEATEDKRNKRSVWEVATQPFSEAHFATYPPALIEPCILAGCPTGGTVLDPFGGAGTTGLVADRLGRNAILVELNPEYAAIAERRLNADAPLFAEVKAA
jgi:DNA modification methylase